MTLDDLVAYGANVDEGIARCMGNEEFYLRMVEIAKNDENFGTLKEAVAAGRLDEAFEAAHALKGSLGNLSLTPLSEPMVEITECLRARTDMDYTALLDAIDEQHAKLCAL